MYQSVHLKITASCYQHSNTLTSDLSCADPEESNSTLTYFDEGERNSKTTKSGPSAARQQNVYMAFRWRAGIGPALNAGLVAL